MRGIRGAITVRANTEKDILEASEELLQAVIKENRIEEEELVSITFTATPDLDRAYPAVAARQLGLTLVPLFCCQEMRVVDSLQRCIRVLVYLNRDCSLEDIKHVYLRDAARLRPDLVND